MARADAWQRKCVTVCVLRGTHREDLPASLTLVDTHQAGLLSAQGPRRRGKESSPGVWCSLSDIYRTSTASSPPQPPTALHRGDPQLSPFMSLWCPLLLTTTLQAVLGASQCALWEMAPPPCTSHCAFINCLYCSLLIGNNQRTEVSFNHPLSAPKAARDWWIQQTEKELATPLLFHVSTLSQLEKLPTPVGKGRGGARLSEAPPP